MKKKSIKLPETAYQMYQFHQKQTHFPLMMSAFLISSESQFQRNRVVRMLADWLVDYKNMGQLLKHKYMKTIPKLLKNLQTLFSMQADINVCLAPYYYQFYTIWKQLTETIAESIMNGSRYALRFIWYLSFDFCERIDAGRQYQFNVYLSESFQEPLLRFQYSDQMIYKQLLQTVRMINIQHPKLEFIQNGQKWAHKMSKIYQTCPVVIIKLQILIQIIGCRSFMLVKPSTKEIWLVMLNQFLTQLQKRVPNSMLNNQTDIRLLDHFSLIINFQQVKKFLIQNKIRFLKTLISNMKKSPDPKNAFHYQMYFSLRNTLINLFYFVNKKDSIKQMEEILTQFNRKYLSVLKDNQQNLQFLDCMCEMKLPISKVNISEIIKSLANSHSRKNFPVNVLIILVRILHSASQEKLSEQNLNSVIKSLSECIAGKVSDAQIFQLRMQISRYYITLADKQQWSQQKSTQIMLMWCQQFQRNNKLSTPQTISLFHILTKKHSSLVFSLFGHKIEPLISDIALKLKFNIVYNNVPLFVSLLMSLYININWGKSHHFVSEVCSKQPQDLTFVYFLQSEVLTRQMSSQDKKISEQQIGQIKFIVGSKQTWKKSCRSNVYLYYLDLFFDKISKQQAIFVLKEMDEIVIKLFQSMYQDIMYHQMIHLASRIFFRVGQLKNLKQLRSYNYFKSQSFDILSRSFHKQTVVLMSSMYSKLMLRSNNLVQFFIELNEGMFLNSLFQGCDDFIGKCNKFFQQTCYIILLITKAKKSPQICGNSNISGLKDLHKNVVWWQQAGYKLTYRLPYDQKQDETTLLIQEFKNNYQQHIREYFKQEIAMSVDKETLRKPKHHEVEDDGYYI